MSYKQLTLRQRYEIRAYMQAGISKENIGEYLNVHRSTVFREVSRNEHQGTYNPEIAQMKAAYRRFNSRKLIRFTDQVKERVEKLLKLDFSPEQISGYLKREYGIPISHETIYQHIWADKQAGGMLYTYLRWSHKQRRKRWGKLDRRGQIRDRVSIDERPKIVDSKERIGDWEIDTIFGKRQKGALVAAVERKSKFTLIDHVPIRKADWVAQTIINMLGPHKDKVSTITVDNGTEFASHKKIAKELNAEVYFAHPYCAWERGLNENTIGLIRQYLPKKTSFEKVPDVTIKFVENRLNIRPRKSLGYRTPLECFLNIKVALGT